MRNFYFRFLLLISMTAPVFGLAQTPNVLQEYFERFQRLRAPTAPVVERAIEDFSDPSPCSAGSLDYEPSVQNGNGETTVIKGDFRVIGELEANFIRAGGHSVGIGRNFLAITGPLFGIRVGGADMKEAADGPDDISITESGDVNIAGAVTAQAFNTLGSIEVKDDIITGDNGMISFKVMDKRKRNVSNVNIMTITADKKVGIGTDNPATELDVRGKITADQLCLPLISDDDKSQIVCFTRLCKNAAGNFTLSTKKKC